jgi:hypothetical protein
MTETDAAGVVFALWGSGLVLGALMFLGALWR